eukprot:scaffold197396_cov46-Prasinocladus_malaysianus.AAC.1
MQHAVQLQQEHVTPPMQEAFRVQYHLELSLGNIVDPVAKCNCQRRSMEGWDCRRMGSKCHHCKGNSRLLRYVV